MEGLWCNAVLLHLILVSCTFDPHCDQQTQGRDANGSQSQKHPGFSSTLPNTRFHRSLRRFFVRLILCFSPCLRYPCCESISDCNAPGRPTRQRPFWDTKTRRYVARQIVRYNLPMSIPTDLQAGPRGDSGTATVALSARRKRFLAFFTFLALSTALVAQQPTGGGTANSPPDNPQPQQQTASSAIADVASDIGYVTHKSWFFPDIATGPEALTHLENSSYS